MSITAVVVVFAVTWFMVFFIVLPIRFVSQAEAGAVVPGTPAGAPAQENVRRKAWITTWISLPAAAAICGVILSGWISVRDFDINGVMGPAPAADETDG
jgi:predicted secreted protein